MNILGHFNFKLSNIASSIQKDDGMAIMLFQNVESIVNSVFILFKDNFTLDFDNV